MSIKQHFARWKETEAAKLRPMTAKQRAGYILHYYRCLLYTSDAADE